MAAVRISKKAITNSFTKHLVFGYIRKIELSFNLCPLPMIILYLVAAYYHISDYIYKVNRDYLIISNDKKTVTNTYCTNHHNQAIYLY